MTPRHSLQIILAIALFGLSFSGYLVYGELFAPAPEATCSPLGEPGTMLGYPPCVYGFVMYLAIALVSGLGLLTPSRGTRRRGHPELARATRV